MSANTETTGAPRDVRVGQVWTAPGSDRIVIESIDGRRVNYADRKGWDFLRTLQFDVEYQLVTDAPPIAAPAAHVERRKGQRWKMVSTRLTMEGTLGDCGDNGMGMRWTLSDAVRSDGVSGGVSCFYFKRWDQPEYTMTLLADAPPEPLRTRGGTCLVCDIPLTGTARDYCGDCKSSKSPPAQEAPKFRDVLCLGGCDYRDPAVHGARWVEWHARYVAKMAAPSCTASAGSCNSPAACGEAGKCIDARMREVVAPADDVRLEESLINRITEAKAYVLGRLESHVHCRACGFVLRLENAMVADGCPCNSGRGINHGLVARNTCTCVVCDPARTGGARKPAALEAKGEPGTHLCPNDYGGPCFHASHKKGAKP